MFESLESRRLMAVTAGIDAYGNLSVRGDPGANTIMVTRPAGDRYYVQASAAPGAPLLPILSVPTAGIIGVYVSGGDGNDFIKVGKEITVPTYLYGEAGDDTIYGDGSYNRISGGPGDDVLYGGPLVDTVSGDDGNDVMYGGSGGDFMPGGAGNDLIHGEDGNDWILGEAGNDSLYGDAGDDMLDAQDKVTGNDLVDGGPGTDTALVDATPVYRLYDHRFVLVTDMMTSIESYSF